MEDAELLTDWQRRQAEFKQRRAISGAEGSKAKQERMKQFQQRLRGAAAAVKPEPAPKPEPKPEVRRKVTKQSSLLALPTPAEKTQNPGQSVALMREGSLTQCLHGDHSVCMAHVKLPKC